MWSSQHLRHQLQMYQPSRIIQVSVPTWIQRRGSFVLWKLVLLIPMKVPLISSAGIICLLLKSLLFFITLFVWACLLLECQRCFSFKNISCTFCYSVECCMMLKSLSICVLIRCFCGKCFQGSYLKLLLRPWHLKMASCQVHMLFELLIRWYVTLFFIYGLSSFQGHFETFMIAATTFLSCIPMTFCLCFNFTCFEVHHISMWVNNSFQLSHIHFTCIFTLIVLETRICICCSSLCV